MKRHEGFETFAAANADSILPGSCCRSTGEPLRPLDATGRSLVVLSIDVSFKADALGRYAFFGRFESGYRVHSIGFDEHLLDKIPAMRVVR